MDQTFNQDQLQEAKNFCDFFIDFMHNFNDKAKYFLSDGVILDYFGQTVKGQKNVANFIKSNIISVRHLFTEAVPVEKIGFRDTHIVKLPKEPKKILMPFFSPPKSNEQKTPTKSIQASTSSRRERGQGDGAHNNNIQPKPRKRLRFGDGEGGNCCDDTDIVEGEIDTANVKYIMSEGAVEFHRRSMKKLQSETKWKRPCKLSVAYTSTTLQDCVIHLIIYEGNVKCRRNLMKDFNSEPSDA